MKKDSPKMAEVASKIITSLKTTRDGSIVRVTILKPPGFEDAVKEAIEKARAAAAETMDANRVRQTILSVLNYESQNNRLPFDADAKLSWRVAITPFAEANEIWEKVDKASDWNSAANRAFADQMPSFLGKESKTLSDICYVIPPKPATKLKEIRDGMSNTIMLVQYSKGVEWMKPQDLSADQVMELVKQLPENGKLLVGFYDGSVHRLPKSIDPETLRRLLDPDDGEAVDIDW